MEKQVQIETIEINGVKYVREDLANDRPFPSIEGKPYEFAIVVADRGHVWIGKVVEGPEYVSVYDGSIIRIWGTTNGLNELVNGPTSNTKLDFEAPIVRISKRAVIAVIPAKESA